MFQLLLLLISYGALLILLMPRSLEGVISTVVVFLLGAFLIILKNFHKKVSLDSKRYYQIPISILLITTLGLNFYNLWLSSLKIKFIASLIHISTESLLLIGSIALVTISSYFICHILQIINDSAPKDSFARSIYSGIVASIITVFLAQTMVSAGILSMGFQNFIFGVLTVSVVILFLFCLLGKIVLSIAIGSGLFMVISTISVYVLQFRGRLFEPVDILSAGTVMNVVENYSLFPIPLLIIAGWGGFIATLVYLYHLQDKRHVELSIKRRLALLSVCVVSCIAISNYVPRLSASHWYTEDAKNNGAILDFIAKFEDNSLSKPDNYSIELIDNLANQYSKNDVVQDTTKYPHIIVIMDEAYSDLSVVGEFSTNIEVTPFISSLKKNTVSGYALASVYGGNTANSEYEFLTGNSMAFISPNMAPYQQYLHSSTYSIVSYLKSNYDYHCIAMHPYISSGWSRPVAYSHLEFDTCYFIEDFPQKNYVRGYVSDREMFEFLIDTYEAQKEEPLFIFGVTMQNHGDYTYTGENYTQSISLKNDKQFPDVEQYLSLIHETDKAVEYLISYFNSVQEDVVIVFFGDHQPKLDNAFYEATNAASTDSLDNQQNRFKVPFFIWTNYDIEEKYIDCTSLNYLSSYVYNAAGIDLPPYNQFLSEMETVIPAINANGFYSLDSECFLPFDGANTEESQWLSKYEMLQYNSLFDKEHLNKTFFPILE